MSKRFLFINRDLGVIPNDFNFENAQSVYLYISVSSDTFNNQLPDLFEFSYGCYPYQLANEFIEGSLFSYQITRQQVEAFQQDVYHNKSGLIKIDVTEAFVTFSQHEAFFLLFDNRGKAQDGEYYHLGTECAYLEINYNE